MRPYDNFYNRKKISRVKKKFPKKIFHLPLWYPKFIYLFHIRLSHSCLLLFGCLISLFSKNSFFKCTYMQNAKEKYCIDSENFVVIKSNFISLLTASTGRLPICVFLERNVNILHSGFWGHLSVSHTSACHVCSRTHSLCVCLWVVEDIWDVLRVWDEKIKKSLMNFDISLVFNAFNEKIAHP